MRGGVLLVGSLSDGALTGGVETGIAMILRSDLVARYNVRLFNTLRHADPQRQLIQRIVYQLKQFYRFIMAILQHRPCLVHVKASEGINFAQGSAYCLIARVLGCRTLLQIHGGTFDAWYLGQGRCVQALVRMGLRFPSAIIALSQYWQTFLSNLAPRKPIHIIPNGVETEQALPRRSATSTQLEVLTIGALGRRKGYFDIVSAAAQLRDQPMRFLFAGPDEFGGETEELRDLARRLDILDRVVFLGTVSGHAKWQLLAKADVFLLPSYNENMPNTVLEAMAAGLPVICTPVGAVPEMLQDTEGAMFIPPADPGAIEKALLRLLACPALRAAMGRRNLAEVNARFAFRHIVKALDALYAATCPER